LSFQHNKLLLLLIVAIIGLFVASPFLHQLTVAPQSEYFTEMALLDSNHTTTLYPSNITSDKHYPLYIELTNHIGHTADYTVEVKFRDINQSGPNSFNHTSSTLPPLENYKLSADNNQTVKLPLDISFQFNTKGYVNSLTINGKTHNISRQLTFNTQRNNYYGNLFFELWIYNQTTNTLQYHERYLSLWLRLNT
jgi:uncharacterized membrane protein